MKRYDLNKSHGVPYGWGGDPEAGAYADPYGDWVRFTDVAPLIAALEYVWGEFEAAQASNNIDLARFFIARDKARVALANLEGGGE